MTPTEVANRLKKIHHRKFRSEEMSGYARELGLKKTNNQRGAALHYVWEESDIIKVKPLIDQ